MEEDTNQGRFSVVPWILLLVIVAAGFFFYKSRQDAKMKEEQQKAAMMKQDEEKKAMREKAKKSLSIKLAPQSNSEQSGSATIGEENGKVVVTLSLAGGNYTLPQPAHFHEGTCEAPGKIVYPLKDAEGGQSKTTLDTTLESLNDQTPLILNVHKSNAELKVYTACGVLE